jgi:hypothetical protein
MALNPSVGLKDTPSPVYNSSLKDHIQGLPHELQEKIYKEIWQGLAKEKSQGVTVELLCREIHKRKVTKVNERVRFLWIKSVFFHYFQFSSFTLQDALNILVRYPEWQRDEIRRYINHFTYKSIKENDHATTFITCDPTDSVEGYQ